MRAQRIANALCAISENIYALLRDVQHRIDVGPDLRFEAIEQQLISALQDIDHLVDVLEQQRSRRWWGRLTRSLPVTRAIDRASPALRR